MGMIERVRDFLNTWTVLTPPQAVTAAAWVASTHFVERWQAVPYLQIGGTMPGCGKTTLMEALEGLVPLGTRPMVIRPAAIVREIAESMSAHDGRPDLVMFFDEAERLSSKRLDDTRSCLATGYTRGATWPVSKGTEVIKMPSFGFKVFALIGDVQPVIRSRCILIDMEPGKPKRNARFEHGAMMAQASELKAELQAAAEAVKNGEYRIADWLDLRQAELWTPLMTTAALLRASADTIRQLETASVDLTALHKRDQRPHLIDKDRAQDAEHAMMSVRLVRDAARVCDVDDEHEAAIFSADLLAGLKAIPIAPWRGWPTDAGLDERGLAALLARQGVSQPTGKSGEPSPVQRGKGRVGRRQARGYRKADIQAAAAKLAE